MLSLATGARLRTALALAVVLAASTDVPAQARQTALIIDGSNSMTTEAEDGSGALTDLAKAMASRFVARLDRPFGVVLFGADITKTDDCANVKTPVPVGPWSVAQVDRADAVIERYVSNGQTPLLAALRQARAALGREGGDIVLLSDFSSARCEPALDVCNGARAALVPAAGRGRVELRVVTAFGAPSDELRALAACTGAETIVIERRRDVDGAVGRALAALSPRRAGGAPRRPEAREPLPDRTPQTPPAPPERVTSAPGPRPVTVRARFGDAGPSAFPESPNAIQLAIIEQSGRRHEGRGVLTAEVETPNQVEVVGRWGEAVLSSGEVRLAAADEPMEVTLTFNGTTVDAETNCDEPGLQPRWTLRRGDEAITVSGKRFLASLGPGQYTLEAAVDGKIPQPEALTVRPHQRFKKVTIGLCDPRRAQP